jgi:hypothetical protein
LIATSNDYSRFFLGQYSIRLYQLEELIELTSILNIDTTPDLWAIGATSVVVYFDFFYCDHICFFPPALSIRNGLEKAGGF